MFQKYISLFIALSIMVPVYGQSETSSGKQRWHTGVTRPAKSMWKSTKKWAQKKSSRLKKKVNKVSTSLKQKTHKYGKLNFDPKVQPVSLVAGLTGLIVGFYGAYQLHKAQTKQPFWKKVLVGSLGLLGAGLFGFAVHEHLLDHVSSVALTKWKRKMFAKMDAIIKKNKKEVERMKVEQT